MRHFIYKCRATAQLFSSDVNEECSYKNDQQDQESSKTELPRGKISSNKINLPNFINNTADSVNLDSWKMPKIDYLENYRRVCAQVHCTARPSQLVYRSNSENTIFAWVNLFYIIISVTKFSSLFMSYL